MARHESDLLIRLKNHIMHRYELCCFLCVENICSLSKLGILLSVQQTEKWLNALKALGFVQFFGGGCTYIFGQLGVQTSLDECIHWLNCCLKMNCCCHLLDRTLILVDFVQMFAKIVLRLE